MARKTDRGPEYLKTREVAEILGISQRTLLRKLASGDIPEPARNPNNNYRLWRPDDVQRLYQMHMRRSA
jgi:excisionase family DNA binding protein